MSSTKNKVSSRKAAKAQKAKPSKPAAKKPAPKKAAAKPAKKAPVKKAAAKPVAKKKIAPVKKVKSKPVPVKKAVPSKKPVAAAKKPIAKKAVKAPAKKGKIAVKPSKPVKKAVAAKKAAPAKKIVSKPSKPVAKKPAPKKAPEIKKPLAKKPEVKDTKPVKEALKPVAEKKEIEKPKAPVDVFSKKPVQKSASDVLAISNTIPVKEKYEISPSKIAMISNSITNPIKKTDSYAVKPEKEPPGKFEMEFVIHASAEMLYEFLSTPSGLSEWFCDDLNIRNGIYTFIWEDQLQQARLLKTLELQLVRFQWVEKTDGSYFEFRIQRDDLTNDISLIVTDFADSVGDRESSKLLWNSQIEKLMHVIGSIF